MKELEKDSMALKSIQVTYHASQKKLAAFEREIKRLRDEVHQHASHMNRLKQQVSLGLLICTAKGTARRAQHTEINLILNAIPELQTI